jgi:hypothetical protein
MSPPTTQSAERDDDEDGDHHEDDTPRADPLSPRSEFIESAKDMGDPAMIATARRVWWAIHFPRTRPCLAEDLDLFRDWCAAA